MVQGCFEVMRADDAYIQAARDSVDIRGLSSYQIVVARAAAALRARLERIEGLALTQHDIAQAYDWAIEDESKAVHVHDFREVYREVAKSPDLHQIIDLWESERNRLDARTDRELYQERNGGRAAKVARAV